MEHTIKITFESIANPSAAPVSPICRIFMPNNCAADTAPFNDTYYDTNVEGWGEGLGLEKFMSSVVAHPGLVAAIRKAIKDGEYTIENAEEKDALYLEEVAKSIKDQGITIEIDGNVIVQ